MIKFENFEVVGWEHAIRGMRNPKNSWERSDTCFGDIPCYNCDNHIPYTAHCDMTKHGGGHRIGPNDHELMMKLAKGGPVHAKYRRMIVVYVDITAPLYWWKEFDTYKVGTVANSCSTMHKIGDKEFTLEDFSCEHLNETFFRAFDEYVKTLNCARNVYINHNRENKDDWWQMIQLLPSSYNQKRTVKLNYEVLTNIYKWRKNHKLDEWREFCTWIESLPYSEIITCEANKVLEVSIKVETPEYFAENLINIRNATNATVMALYKGVHYVACDDTTVEDIVDAISVEMESREEPGNEAL